MCGPVLAATAVAATGQLAGTVMQSRAAQYNADLARSRAAQEREVARIESNRQRAKVRRLLGAQRALYGASGVRIEGSPAEIMADTAAQGERDALLISYGGEIRARDAEKRAEATEFGRRQNLFAAPFRIGSTVLGGYATAREFGEIGDSSEPEDIQRTVFNL